MFFASPYLFGLCLKDVVISILLCSQSGLEIDCSCIVFNPALTLPAIISF